MSSQSRIEPEVDSLVSAAGGRRCDAVYSPGQGEKNADYVFQTDNVIAELKSLEKDQFADTAAHLESLVKEWIATDQLPRPQPGLTVYRTQSVPTAEQRRVFKPVVARIRATVKSTNTQIKETKKRLGMNDAKGVLILVNDGNTVLELECAFYVLAQVFRPDNAGKRPFSGIDRLIYFTVNMPGVAPGYGPQTQVWATPYFGQEDRSLDPFLERLKEAWFRHQEAKSALPMPTFDLSAEEIGKIRFRDASIPLNRAGNPLLANSFTFGEGLEQQLIDALAGQVKLLRNSDHLHAEMMRLIVTAQPGWDPGAMFPTFQRMCQGFRVHYLATVHQLLNWPGQALVSILISKQREQDWPKSGSSATHGRDSVCG